MDDETAARLAALEAHVDWLYQRAGYAPPYGRADLPNASAASGGGSYSTAVLELVRAGNKIGAIKQYREETGASLREAMEAVERLG